MLRENDARFLNFKLNIILKILEGSSSIFTYIILYWIILHLAFQVSCGVLKSLVFDFVFLRSCKCLKFAKIYYCGLKGLKFCSKLYRFSWSSFEDCIKGVFDVTSKCYKFSFSSRPTLRVACRKGSSLFLLFAKTVVVWQSLHKSAPFCNFWIKDWRKSKS